MALDVRPIAETARWFERAGGYERWESPLAVATLIYTGEGIAYIGPMQGERMSRAMLRELQAYLRSRGITTVHFERHGALRAASIDGKGAI